MRFGAARASTDSQFFKRSRANCNMRGKIEVVAAAASSSYNREP